MGCFYFAGSPTPPPPSSSVHQKKTVTFSFSSVFGGDLNLNEELRLRRIPGIGPFAIGKGKET